MWSFCPQGKNEILSGAQRRDPPDFLSFILYLLSFLEAPMTPIVKYKKLDPRAVVPQYATPGAAAAFTAADALSDTDRGAGGFGSTGK